MQVEQLERLVLADRAGMLARPGMKYADAPSVEDAVRAFDEALTATPALPDPAQTRRLRAVGAA